jgi:hypothetical protein
MIFASLILLQFTDNQYVDTIKTSINNHELQDQKRMITKSFL